jgi:polygalacturonase
VIHFSFHHGITPVPERGRQDLTIPHPQTYDTYSVGFSIFGAHRGGEQLSTRAIAIAIDQCHEAGGGRVVVPADTFLTGAIHLKSNVNLHMEEGAVLLFSTHPEDYLPMVFTRWEGIELMNYSPLIYASEQENIAVTGKGKLDGQASDQNWWSWCGSKRYGWQEGMPRQNSARDSLQKLNHREVPPRERIFGPGYSLRPNFVQFEAGTRRCGNRQRDQWRMPQCVCPQLHDGQSRARPGTPHQDQFEPWRGYRKCLF